MTNNAKKTGYTTVTANAATGEYTTDDGNGNVTTAIAPIDEDTDIRSDADSRPQIECQHCGHPAFRMRASDGLCPVGRCGCKHGEPSNGPMAARCLECGEALIPNLSIDELERAGYRLQVAPSKGWIAPCCVEHPADNSLDAWWHEDHFGDDDGCCTLSQHSEQCVNIAFRAGWDAATQSVESELLRLNGPSCPHDGKRASEHTLCRTHDEHIYLAQCTRTHTRWFDGEEWLRRNAR